MKRILNLVLMIALIGISTEGLACPMCFSAKGGTLNAYRLSTILLTFIPLIGFGVFFYWLRKKSKEMDS